MLCRCIWHFIAMLAWKILQLYWKTTVNHHVTKCNHAIQSPKMASVWKFRRLSRTLILNISRCIQSFQSIVFAASFSEPKQLEKTDTSVVLTPRTSLNFGCWWPAAVFLPIILKLYYVSGGRGQLRLRSHAIARPMILAIMTSLVSRPVKFQWPLK